ncbi:MAG: hypothetical protein ACRDYV_17435 [Acidimicrobiia bacterium]
MTDLTFNVALAVAGFITVFACFRGRQQLGAAMEEMRSNHRELLGEIQGILARISGDLDRLQRLIPQDDASEARHVAQGLVRAIDEIVLITRGDWRQQAEPDPKN